MVEILPQEVAIILLIPASVEFGGVYICIYIYLCRYVCSMFVCETIGSSLTNNEKSKH